MRVINILSEPVKDAGELSSRELHAIFGLDAFCRFHHLLGRTSVQCITHSVQGESERTKGSALREFVKDLAIRLDLINIEALSPVKHVADGMWNTLEEYDYVVGPYHPMVYPDLPDGLRKKIIDYGGIRIESDLERDKSGLDNWLRYDEKTGIDRLRWFFTSISSRGFLDGDKGVDFLNRKGKEFDECCAFIARCSHLRGSRKSPSSRKRIEPQEEEFFALLQAFLPASHPKSCFNFTKPGDLQPPYEMISLCNSRLMENVPVSPLLCQFLEAYAQCVAYVWVPSLLEAPKVLPRWPTPQTSINGKPLDDVLKRIIPVQIDGKLVGKVEVTVRDALDELRLLACIRRDPKLADKLKGKETLRTVFVKGKLINIVTKK